MIIVIVVTHHTEQFVIEQLLRCLLLDTEIVFLQMRSQFRDQTSALLNLAYVLAEEVEEASVCHLNIILIVDGDQGFVERLKGLQVDLCYVLMRHVSLLASIHINDDLHICLEQLPFNNDINASKYK